MQPISVASCLALQFTAIDSCFMEFHQQCTHQKHTYRRSIRNVRSITPISTTSILCIWCSLRFGLLGLVSLVEFVRGQQCIWLHEKSQLNNVCFTFYGRSIYELQTKSINLSLFCIFTFIRDKYALCRAFNIKCFTWMSIVQGKMSILDKCVGKKHCKIEIVPNFELKCMFYYDGYWTRIWFNLLQIGK